MFFNKAGYAFHGSPKVPGQNASHGCVRIFTDDAKWLNENFVEIGTTVIINPYPD
jgi:lipoprotein-anchoring transpeptidase ErfK/SrfK